MGIMQVPAAPPVDDVAEETEPGILEVVARVGELLARHGLVELFGVTINHNGGLKLLVSEVPFITFDAKTKQEVARAAPLGQAMATATPVTWRLTADKSDLDVTEWCQACGPSRVWVSEPCPSCGHSRTWGSEIRHTLGPLVPGLVKIGAAGRMELQYLHGCHLNPGLYEGLVYAIDPTTQTRRTRLVPRAKLPDEGAVTWRFHATGEPYPIGWLESALETSS